MTVESEFKTDRLALTLGGPLTREAALRLRQQVELAVDYYCYAQIDLLIDSPGGELQALDTLLAELNRWRNERDIAVRTRVIGEAASAAAFLLALGDVGRRVATPGSRILFHEPRAIVRGDGVAQWTRVDFTRVGALIESASERLLAALVRHVWVSAGKSAPLSLGLPGEKRRRISTEDSLRRVYERLLRAEVWLEPEEALGLRLVDQIGFGAESLVHGAPQAARPGRAQ